MFNININACLKVYFRVKTILVKINVSIRSRQQGFPTCIYYPLLIAYQTWGSFPPCSYINQSNTVYNLT